MMQPDLVKMVNHYRSLNSSTIGNKDNMCIICFRTFPTKSGLSQFKRHSHPYEYALQLQLDRDAIRNHMWTGEEV